MPTSPPKTEPDGFTLMEMLMVLAIVALVGGIAMTRLPAAAQAGKRERMVALARQTIRDARTQAMANGRVIVVEASTLRSLSNDLGVRDPRGASRLVFYPDGSASGGQLLLAGAPLLTIDWLTGIANDAH